MKQIVVLTSGGDAPGMNAAIRAVVRTAHYYGLTAFGARFGYKGLIEQNLIPLTPDSVANCLQLGGTILKTERYPEFSDKSTRDQCRAFLNTQGIDGLIVIGGNGSLTGAALLAAEADQKLAVIGIPGSIDNDIPGTEYSIGFDTARNTALRAIDQIRDTANSHNRNFLVEVMGRESGALAIDVGVAGGAEFILTPEHPLSLTDLAQRITQRRRPKLNSIIVVAEAGEPGRSVQMAATLEQLTQQSFRVCVLGHTQRGGSPSTLDRLAASQMGYLAVKSLVDGVSNKMVAMHDNRFTLAPLMSNQPLEGHKNIESLVKINNILCL